VRLARIVVTAAGIGRRSPWSGLGGATANDDRLTVRANSPF
jgi:hypothetical protein